MTRRRVAAFRYFNGETQLEGVRWFHFGADGKPDGSSRTEGSNAQFGTALGVPHPHDFSAPWEIGHRQDWLRVDRAVKFLTKPDPHECDFRCVGGKPGGECWCQCGGKNHGRKFTCDFA